MTWVGISDCVMTPSPPPPFTFLPLPILGLNPIWANSVVKSSNRSKGPFFLSPDFALTIDPGPRGVCVWNRVEQLRPNLCLSLTIVHFLNCPCVHWLSPSISLCQPWGERDADRVRKDYTYLCIIWSGCLISWNCLSCRSTGSDDEIGRSWRTPRSPSHRTTGRGKKWQRLAPLPIGKA